MIQIPIKDEAIVSAVYRQEANKKADLIQKVCSITPESLGLEPDEERGLPGEKRYQDSGWCHRMLSRYFYTGQAFCQGMRVAELCSGIGWGAFILSHYAKELVCVEFSRPTLELAAATWRADNIQWLNGDVLNLPVELAPESFDVITAMEAIEHFTVRDGFVFLKNAARLLRPGGHFIASSYYPDTEEEAARICAPNPHHLHIFTTAEMSSFGQKFFRKSYFLGRYLFVAQK